MKAIVKDVTPDGDWTNNYGTFYQFLIEFEDDTEVYQYSSKKNDQTYFKVGWEIEYEITKVNSNFPDKIRPLTQSCGVNKWQQSNVELEERVKDLEDWKDKASKWMKEHSQ